MKPAVFVLFILFGLYANAQLTPVKKYVLDMERKRGTDFLNKYYHRDEKILKTMYDSTITYYDDREMNHEGDRKRYYEVEKFEIKNNLLILQNSKKWYYEKQSSRSIQHHDRNGLALKYELWNDDTLQMSSHVLLNADSSLNGYALTARDGKLKTNSGIINFNYINANTAVMSIKGGKFPVGKQTIIVNSTANTIQQLQYDKKGVLTDKFLIKLDSSGNEILRKITKGKKVTLLKKSVYDKKNRLVEESETNPYQIEQWKYDEKDSLIYNLSVYEKDSTIETIVNTANEQTRIKRSTDGPGKVRIKEQKITYNAKGQPVLILETEKGNENKLLGTVQYTYDEQGREIKKFIGHNTRTETFETEYSQAGKTRIIKHYEQDKLNEVKYITLDYYK